MAEALGFSLIILLSPTPSALEFACGHTCCLAHYLAHYLTHSLTNLLHSTGLPTALATSPNVLSPTATPVLIATA